MVTFEIEANGEIYEIEAPDEQTAVAAFQKHAAQFAPPAPDAPSEYSQSHVGQGVYGINEGIGNALGFPVDAINSALGVIGLGSERPFLGSAQINELMGNVGAVKPETSDPSKQFVRRVGQEVGAALPFGMGAARGAKTAFDAAKVVGGSVAAAIPSGAGAATAQQVLPGNDLAEIAGQVIGGFTPMGLSAAIRRRKSATAAPSVQELEDQATGKYQQAERSGLVVAQPSFGTLADTLASKAMERGLDETLTPSSVAAIKRMQQMAGGNVTAKDMATLRKVIGAAAQGADPKYRTDRAIASMMIEDLDNYLIGLGGKGPNGEANLSVLAGDPVQAASAYSEARGLSHRAFKGDMIDTAIELAASRAGQFSGSGFENALRTEFRALERKIIKGELKGLSEDEIAAIRKVAQGGPVDSILRGIGKAAPTGVVSFSASGGVPFFVGNAIGGPALGAALAGATMGAGILGRTGATALQKRNAAVASALVRRGGKAKPSPILSDEQKMVAEALLAAQVANQ